MRVNVKGLHWTVAKLADGTARTYWYAWRGGPRLSGEYGSPEFIASYNAAVATKVVLPEGRLLALTQAYQTSQDFLGLRERTRADYIQQLVKIEQRFGDAPLKAMADARTRGIFLDWRDELALQSKRQADYAWQVLARVLSWAKDRGKITVNPCERGGRVYHGTRADFVWSVEDETAFLEHAPAQLHLPLLLGLWTGQRQGDLLRLPWSGYDGSTIRLRQSKTGIRVVIPVGAPLKAALDAAPRRSPIILTSKSGKPWTEGGFRASWRIGCDAAAISELTFNDLRGTAVTRLALVGCTEAMIATITGHSLSNVRSILDKHYLHRDIELARSAITKLEMGYAKSAGAENRNRVFKMSLKMVARVQIEKREKPHAIKRLAQAASNRHSRCMSPLLATYLDESDSRLTCLKLGDERTLVRSAIDANDPNPDIGRGSGAPCWARPIGG